MLGISKRVTRSELLRMKHTGIAKEFSDWVQTNVLDYGHEVEAKARPLVEELIDDELYPATYSMGELSASCDGLTMEGTVAFEHKQYSASLFASVQRGELPEEHQPQCQQVMMVTGAASVFFVCSDGTPENFAYIEVSPDEEWQNRITAGWKQFQADLAAYIPQEVIPAAVAAPIKELPAVIITSSGSLSVETNFDIWEIALREFITKIPEKPSTDQEFADCKAAIAAFKKAEATLDAEEARVLSLVPSVDEMKRHKTMLRELSSTTRLALEKLVVRRDQEVKVEIIQVGKDALSAHIASLNKRIAPVQMPAIVADFAAAIKSKRNLENMRGAVSDLIAAKKIESNELADKIDANLKTLNTAGHEYLFRDYAALAMKASDDLALIIKTRIEAEETRIRDENERILASEREKIRAEEEAKAQAKVKAEHDAETAERNRLQGIAEAEAVREMLAKQNITPAQATRTSEMRNVETPAHGQRETTLVQQADTGATMNIGEINRRLGFMVSAEFLLSLGFAARQEKNARLYRESDFTRICSAIVRHVELVANAEVRRAA